jgi:hypothetical protein
MRYVSMRANWIKIESFFKNKMPIWAFGITMRFSHEAFSALL